MKKQAGREASVVKEASEIFLENGCNVKSLDNSQVSLAWRILSRKKYNILDMIAYKTSNIEDVVEDKRRVYKFFQALPYYLTSNPSSLLKGLEMRDFFGVKAPYYRDKPVMIVVEKLLVSRSRGEGDYESDLVRVVPISELPSLLGIRKNIILRRGDWVFKTEKFEALKKAYMRAKKGLMIAIFLTFTLPVITLLNLPPALFQLLLILNSILIVVTIVGSIVIHELGVANFKKILKQELSETQKLSEEVAEETRFGRIEIKSVKKKLDREVPEVPMLEEALEPEPLKFLGVEEEDEFYTRQVDSLWNLAQKNYAEGSLEDGARHLNEAVICALKEAYKKLTGKAVFGNPLKAVEIVLKNINLDRVEFTRFYSLTASPTKITEDEFARLNEYAQRIIEKLGTVKTATFEEEPLKVDSQLDAQKGENELPLREEQLSREVVVQKTKSNKRSSKGKTPRRGGRSKTEANLEDSAITNYTLGNLGEPKGAKSCETVIGEMVLDAAIREKLDSLIGSKGLLCDSPVFLVITQSAEVMRVVESLVQRYPEVAMGILERAVNGKGQIIVSRSGIVICKTAYESQMQLEKLIQDQLRYSRNFKPARPMDDFIGILEE
ncbi:MAG: hypothetical protein KIH09_12700 [Candidatus Freyarchaeota archaeon]|nr:hypothetical protein [Candidatus Jordarchaeia archaeon]